MKTNKGVKKLLNYTIEKTDMTSLSILTVRSLRQKLGHLAVSKWDRPTLINDC